MKLTQSRFIFVLSALCLASPWRCVRANYDCLNPDTVKDNVDYFPDKVQPFDSKYWTIEYANTYKIIRNLDANTSYLLYQCGTTVPEDQAKLHNAIVSIPVSEVVLTETPMITYLQQIGKLDAVVAFLSDPSYVSAPCFNEKIQSGVVSSTLNVTSASPIAFSSPFSLTSFPTNIIISEFAEKSNQAIFEWLKVYSAFFNLEALATRVTAAASERWDCVAESAGAVTADFTKPTVLYGYYNDYCGGWTVADCSDGNYYCDFAEACNVNLLSSKPSEGDISACDTNYFSTAELVEFGKNADYWIYVADNWDSVYENYTESLDTMKSVNDKHVFDIQGSGLNAWFEERYADYYDVLQDFCAVVGTTPGLGRNAWFRNVFTEEVGAPEECNVNFPFEDAKCSNLANTNETKSNGTSSSKSGATALVSGVFVILVIVHTVCLM